MIFSWKSFKAFIFVLVFFVVNIPFLSSFKLLPTSHTILRRSIPALRMSSSLRAQASSTVRVATYNILSSHLASPQWFLSCKPENLDASTRMKRIKTKLLTEMEKQSIICLQEVSHVYAGQLHTFFSAHNYHLITACYGNRHNNYMGVAIAVPLTSYSIKDVNIIRIADTKRMPKPVYEEVGFFFSLSLCF
jgi:hypothetical protein